MAKINRKLGAVLASLLAAGCATDENGTVGSVLRLTEMPTMMLAGMGQSTFECGKNALLCLSDPVLERADLSTQTVFDVAVKSLAALDARYAEYFSRSHFLLAQRRGQSYAPNAIAFFVGKSAFTVINDFEDTKAKTRAFYNIATADMAAEARPSYGQFLAVRMMTALSNEYAHWRQYNQGLYIQAENDAASDFDCAVYARMQHASDLMSMDMLKRLLVLSRDNKDARTGFAATISASILLNWNRAMDWSKAVIEGDDKSERKAIAEMARYRLPANNATVGCVPQDGTLPWVTTHLPKSLIQSIDAPITQPFPDELKFRAP